MILMLRALPTRALLKGIPPNLSAEMLFALAKMGHGDEIVLGDANFPARYYFVQHIIPIINLESIIILGRFAIHGSSAASSMQQATISPRYLSPSSRWDENLADHERISS